MTVSANTMAFSSSQTSSVMCLAKVAIWGRWDCFQIKYSSSSENTLSIRSCHTYIKLWIKCFDTGHPTWGSEHPMNSPFNRPSLEAICGCALTMAIALPSRDSPSKVCLYTQVLGCLVPELFPTFSGVGRKIRLAQKLNRRLD